MTSGYPLTDNKKTVACLDNTHVSHRIGGVGHSMSKVQRDRLAAESSRLLLRSNVRLNHTVLARPKIEEIKAVIALPDKSQAASRGSRCERGRCLSDPRSTHSSSSSYGVPRFGVPVVRPEYPTCSEATRGRPKQTGGHASYRGDAQPLISIKDQAHFAIRKLWDDNILFDFSM